MAIRAVRNLPGYAKIPFLELAFLLKPFLRKHFSDDDIPELEAEITRAVMERAVIDELGFVELVICSVGRVDVYVIPRARKLKTV